MPSERCRALLVVGMRPSAKLVVGIGIRAWDPRRQLVRKKHVG